MMMRRMMMTSVGGNCCGDQDCRQRDSRTTTTATATATAIAKWRQAKISKVNVLLLASCLLALACCANALDNGLALKPPMGWLAWERFTCQTDCSSFPESCINAHLFETMAERLVQDGFVGAGYQYVNIDDCWSELNRQVGTDKLQANYERFPDGIRPLSDHLHSMGLKLGIYGDCGSKTCAKYPAQLKEENKTDHDNDNDNYFDLDANSLAQWQVDSFKFDGCYIDPLKAESICPKMAQALKTHTRPYARPILLICEWPFYMMYAHAQVNFSLAAESCNVWRYYDDIEDSWQSILNTIDYSVKHQSTIVKYHGPGHWFDPDQLLVGNFGLSRQQERAQMAIWAAWSAPLYMSNDLRLLNAHASDLLKNKHLIQVNQDPMGVWALMVGQSNEGQLQAFVKPIEPIRNGCPSFMVVYLNRATLGNRVKVAFALRDLLLRAPIREAAKQQRSYSHLSTAAAVAAAGGFIEPANCLDRLAGFNESRFQAKPIKYQVLDLLDQVEARQVRLEDQLELEVAPSGVRAVRLDELAV